MKANKLRKAGKKINIFGIFRNVAVFIVIFATAICIYIYLRPIRSVLPIKHVVFTGNKHLTDDELMVLVGVHLNDSLITVSNKKVSQRLLKSPWIISVNVRKQFPDTLSMVIDEAVPFALLDMNSHLFLMDEKGKLLEELKGDSIPFLPVITGDPFRESEGFSEAINLVRLMNGKGFSSERDHIDIIARKPHELTVTVDGTVVKMGSGRFEEKLERLIELEDEIKDKGIPVDYIDLRFVGKAIVKPIANEVVR
jgi:cell division protein FtsQ